MTLRLLNLLTLLSLLLCVTVAALWLRSYWVSDTPTGVAAHLWTGNRCAATVGRKVGPVSDENTPVLPEQSGAAELSPTEFVVACMYEFHRQLFINGFDGFVSNTGGEFTDFLPVAIAAIGGHRYSLLARLAWEDRGDTEGRFDAKFFELIREEPYDELLTAYVERHRGELPDPSLATSDFFAQWEVDKQRWWAAKYPEGDRRSR